MIFEILHAIWPFGCIVVVGIILAFYNREISKISVIAV